MGIPSGQVNAEPEILVTREVRWFVPGPVPASVVDWFSAVPMVIGEETRIDHYDPMSAQSGIGLKYRAGSTFDAKYLLSHETEVALAIGVAGRVGDWVKVSRPITDPGSLTPPLIAVRKHLRTRRYTIDDDVDPVGCEVELAAVSVEGADAWSLCFETYGSPEQRHAALTHGVESFLADTPLDSGMRLEPHSSCAYPSWITQLRAAA